MTLRGPSELTADNNPIIIISLSLSNRCTKKQKKYFNFNHFRFPNLLCASNMRY